MFPPARPGAEGGDAMRGDRGSKAATILLVLAIASPAGAAAPFGAPTVAPTWTARFDQPIRWQHVHPLGPLVVATDSSLHGIDPASGALAWTRGDLEAPAEDSFEVLHGTALFAVSAGRLRDRTLVLDATDGHVVFDSRAAGIASILGRSVLFGTGGLLILGQEQGDPKVKLFLAEMETGRIRWVNDEVLGGLSPAMNKLAGVLAKIAQATSQGTQDARPSVRPLEVGPDAVVLASGAEIWKLSTDDGRFLWRIRNRDGSGRAELFVPPSRPGLLVVGTEIEGQGMSTGGATPVTTAFSAYRLADGAPIWPKAIKMRGSLNPPVFLQGGALLSSGGGADGGLKHVDYDTGLSTWGKNGKGIDADGGIVDHQTTDAGLVITTGRDSVWTSRGTIYSLNVLDVTSGALRFPNPLKVKGRLLWTEAVARGVLYATTNEVGIFDPRTGTSLLGEALVSDGLVTADAGPILYVFSRDDGALWRVDKPEARATRLSPARIELEEDDLPRALEVTADRVTLLGAQSIVGFDREGTLLFHRYYPAPGNPAWLRALLIAQSVRMGMAAAQAGAGSVALAQYAATQENGTLEREVADQLSRGYAQIGDAAAGASSAYARMARQRFQASAEARDFHFMMVQLDGGYGIAQVDKATGAIRSAIPIGRDKAPSYEVDDVARRIYYRPTDRELLGYAF